MSDQGVEVLDPDGRAIDYAVTGSGPTTVVLLPGGSLFISYLEPLAATLAEAGLRAVRVGARRPVGEPTMHDLAQDVVDVLDHLEISTAWVSGHAFGNRVARAVALDHQDRVEGVVLLAAGGTVPPSEQADHDLAIAFSDASDEDAVTAMRSFVGDPAEARSAWDHLKPSRDFRVGAMQREAVVGTPQEEWATLVPGMPVVIVQGTCDQIAPPANGEQLAQASRVCPGLAWIEGAGHLFVLLQPERTAEAILSAIRDSGSAEPGSGDADSGDAASGDPGQRS